MGRPHAARRCRGPGAVDRAGNHAPLNFRPRLAGRAATRAEATAQSSHGEVRAQVIKRPEGEPDRWYDELCRTLKPGDLLYVSDKDRTKAVHVIMWIGECGDSPDRTPLIMDSTGGKAKDCEGHAIPCGIHLRPFARGSWYHTRFAHAHRWIEG